MNTGATFPSCRQFLLGSPSEVPQFEISPYFSLIPGNQHWTVVKKAANPIFSLHIYACDGLDLRHQL